MPPDTLAQSAAPTDGHSVLPAEWRRPLGVLVFGWAFLLAAFWHDWSGMADQWWNASTYNHIVFVPLILGWLVAQRWSELRRVTVSGWWPGIVLFAGAAFIWLAGALAEVNLLRHAGAVGMAGALVPAVLGPRVAWGLLFPLCYAAFLVPFGDELVPALQMITAEITIALTHASGIPAEIDGVFIDTPVGLFEVAEACSGVKFLVAMVALGTLIAHLCFRSWTRRIAFMALAVIVPIIANGIRAWGTIYVAQSQGIEFAVGFDHILYGWVFFALVLALVLAIAWRYFDRAPDDKPIYAGPLNRSPTLAALARLSFPSPASGLACLAIALAALLWAGSAMRAQASVPETIALPQVPGWELVEYAPAHPWEPLASGADHRLVATYRNENGASVDVFYALYAAQGEGREAGGFGQGALVPGTAWRWLEGASATPEYEAGWYQALGRHRRYAETSYRTGNVLTGSNTRLKLANLTDRFAMRVRPTSVLIIGGEDADAPEHVAAFRAAIAPTSEWMDAIAAGR